MKSTQLFLFPTLLATTSLLSSHLANAQTDVVAFWDFGNPYDFDDGADGPNKQDFLASGFGVDNTIGGDANFQAFLGNAGNLDDNGGGGFTGYTSPVSGISYGPSRTVKWDDIAGGGDDFDIGGVTEFNVMKGSDPVELDDFGNDALIYMTFDATGYTDLQFRFDVEATPDMPDPDAPGETISLLPTGFDVFYRITGPGGTWIRPDEFNNIDLSFMDYDPVDPDNQFADTGFISFGSALDDASMVEIIFQDFDGNEEMEIDNFEIVANAVPEPTSAILLLVAGLGMTRRRRR